MGVEREEGGMLRWLWFILKLLNCNNDFTNFTPKHPITNVAATSEQRSYSLIKTSVCVGAGTLTPFWFSWSRLCEKTKPQFVSHRSRVTELKTRLRHAGQMMQMKKKNKGSRYQTARDDCMTAALVVWGLNIRCINSNITIKLAFSYLERPSLLFQVL